VKTDETIDASPLCSSTACIERRNKPSRATVWVSEEDAGHWWTYVAHPSKSNVHAPERESRLQTKKMKMASDA